MLVTRSAASGADAATYEEAIRRHLGAIPQQENFHCHRDGCSWRIELVGDEHAEDVRVKITGRVKLLPLLDMGATLLGISDEHGCMQLGVEAGAPAQNGWVASSEFGMEPTAWVGKWK